MGSFSQKLKVILWKSYVLRKRHFLLSCFEIVAPLFLFYLFAKYAPSDTGNHNDYVVGPVQDLHQLLSQNVGSYNWIAYTPSTPETNNLMSEVKKYFDRSYVEFLNFSSVDQLDKWLNEDSNAQGTFSLIFKSNPMTNMLQYEIRVDENFIPPLTDLFGFPFLTDLYARSWFAPIQIILDTTFIKKITGESVDIMLQPFPMQGSIVQGATSGVFALVIVFSFVFIVPAVVKRIVEEKLTGIKEFQKMMGLQYWMWWGGWMIHSLVMYVPSIIIIIVILKIHWHEGALVYQVDSWLIMFFLFSLFLVATILFCFAISSLFKSPNLAMVTGVLLWLVPPFTIIAKLAAATPMTSFTQMVTCLSPPVCLSWGFSIFITVQQRGETWTWGSFFERNTTGGLSTAHIVLMFLVDWIIFAVITWYVSSVKPGPYGRAKPFYFMFQCWNKNEKTIMSQSDESQLNFEDPPPNTKVGIRVQNLRKVFGSKVAVDKVDVDIYEGEITALLGHNGAGKTTTMSILTGLFSPTAGKVVVAGENIFDHMDKFQQNLGLCPQHNLLFSYLTAIEHLIFFGMMKGLSAQEAEDSGRQLLSQLHMEAKVSQFPDKLSGGMQRKLCFAIALMGNPKVLMLDEPTAGMDPESRREVWDILLSYRGERTILITTHFMEEADVLGDRIAIMDHGRVSCYGTSIFLKKLYGTGYHITITRNSNSSEEDITSVIKSHVTDTKLHSSFPTQLTYNMSEQDSFKFPSLFKTLETQKDQLGITGVGVACTTMEDVFLRVADGGMMTDGRSSPDEDMTSPLLTAHTKSKLSGCQLIIQQFRALIHKKIIFIQRTWLSSIIFALIPLVAVLIALGGISFDRSDKDISKELNLQLYSGSEVPFTINTKKSVQTEFKTLVSDQGSVAQLFSGNINQGLISKVKEDKSYYRRAVVAAEFNQTTYTGLFNLYALHSIPISINVISNTILRRTHPKSSIVVVNHPLLSTFDRSFKKDECHDMNSMAYGMISALSWILVTLAISLTVSRTMALPVLERASSAKQLQLMTSSPILYWITHFLVDFLHYFVSILLAWLAVWVLDKEENYVKSGKMGVLFYLLLMYGVSGTPFTYLLSFMTKSTPKAMSFIMILNIVTGMIAPLVNFALQTNQANDTSSLRHELFNFLLCLNPLYSLSAALVQLIVVMVQESRCIRCHQVCPEVDLFKPSSEKNPSSILQFVIFLSTEWIIYWAIILSIESGWLRDVWAKLTAVWIGPINQHSTIEDDDVVREKDRARSSQNGSVLRAHGLGKKYSKQVTAVEEASFLVEKGECFGLLGVNGAGKTTIFKMLTGEEIPTAGTASILEYDLVTEKTKYLQEIGYCPQSNAIIDFLTGEEMLRLFSALRGVSDIESEVSSWIPIIGLQEYSKAPCGKYSGGNKRKLCTAVSLVGDPPLVFLDEPTAGVDPVSRRKLWNVLAQCQQKRQAIVLTSHSMEECEALCSRITIMVAGRMKCIGTTQHLKHKFGQGYTIMIKLSPVYPEPDRALVELKAKVSQLLSNCLIKDEHKGLIHYHLTDNRIPLSTLFEVMEVIRKDHPLIEDYTVSDTTLEQVFMSFARQGAAVSSGAVNV